MVTNEPGFNAQILLNLTLIVPVRENSRVIIFPGFFGYTQTDKDTCTFSSSGGLRYYRGYLANGCCKLSVYENFTDVDAIYVA